MKLFAVGLQLKRRFRIPLTVLKKAYSTNLRKGRILHTVFPQISALGAYLILKLSGAVLIRGRRLKEGGVYSRVREISNIKF